MNCRILPGHTKVETRETLRQIIADPAIAVRYVSNAFNSSDIPPTTPVFTPQPLRSDVLDSVKKISQQMWPGVPVIPTMVCRSRASDGIYTSAAGIPTYIVAGVEIGRNDDREHGRDERVGVQSFYRGLEFWYQFLERRSQAQREITGRQVL